MFPALLTTLFFALSAVTGTRAGKLLGSGTEANFWRLCLATAFLAIYAHGFAHGLAGAGFYMFILSGCVGFGLGDVALFQAYPRLGSRLTILLVHCLAAPMAALVEWWWLGTALTSSQMLAAAIILAGVALALAPGENLHIPRPVFLAGITWGTLAAIGQAGGAVLSRKADLLTQAGGLDINGVNQAYQRIVGGLVVSGIFLLFTKREHFFDSCNGAENGGTLAPMEKLRRVGPWLLANALCGPTIGVSCYQWALKTTPTGIVLPIVALTPLVVIPLARVMEGERATRRSLAGCVVAVAGAVILKIAS
jgi:drug/metabolite transporter (DMT)-like permease